MNSIEQSVCLTTNTLFYIKRESYAILKFVVRLFRNESKDWTGVTVNGLEIVSTPGHKYFLPETKKWVSAEDLKVGTKVLLSDGSYGIIESVRTIHYDKPQTTYNFEVADFHTYYVGNGVLVHNMNGDCSGRGSNNPKTRAAERGRKMHESWDYGPGTEKEYRIPGVGRADAVDKANKIVYELKPNNPRAIARGYKQLERYISGLGEAWIGKLITYN